MFCGKCGSETSEQNKFCSKCGASLEIRIVKTEEAPKEECPIVEQPKVKPVKKSKKNIGVWVVLAAVLLVSVIMVKGFVSVLKESDTVSQEANSELDKLIEDEPMVEGLGKATDKPRNDAQVTEFTQRYGGVWYVTKEFNAEKEWVYYELGKKLMIFAWNNFNDYDYQPIVGSYTMPREERKYYYKGRLMDVDYIGTKTEFIYGETQHMDGIDIDYHEKFIVLSETDVDLTGLGGPKFAIEDFRYENINGRDYLISDIYGFALMWDGDYLEYCEPDAHGYYQGYYAFRYYNIDSLISQDWNDEE